MTRWLTTATVCLLLVFSFIGGAGMARGDFNVPWASTGTAKTLTLTAQLKVLRQQRSTLVARRTAEVALSQLGARGDTSFIAVEAGVPAASAISFRTWAKEEVATLQLEATGFRVLVANGDSRAPNGQQRVGRTWVLPGTDGQPCVAVVHMVGPSAAQMAVIGALRASRAWSMAGPCAFFAAFGIPGSGIRTWFDTVGYSFGLLPYGQPRAVGGRTTKFDRQGLPAPARACLLGNDDACESSLGMVNDTALISPLPPAPSYVVALSSAPTGQLGHMQSSLLQDLREIYGDQRFGQFWRSNRPPAEAFAQAFGQPPAPVLRAWLARNYDALHGGPALPLPIVSAAVVATLGALAIALSFDRRV